MSEKDLLKENIKRENNLNKVILNLTRIEGDKNRLLEMLQGLNVGEKRIYNDDLEIFIKGNSDLKEEEKNEFLQLIEENKQIYDEIEKEVVEKLGLELEKVQKSKIKHHENKKDFDDFQESFVDLSLNSSLNSISSSHRIIQQELANLQVTPQNIDKVENLLNKIEQESIDWLKYLTEQKKNGKFVLLEDKTLDLYDVTIAETQKTLKMIEVTKEDIKGKNMESDKRKPMNNSQNINAQRDGEENIPREAEDNER